MPNFEFCRNYYLPAEDLLDNLDLPVDGDMSSECWERYIRIVDNDVIQVSDKKYVFDRWANSVEKEFKISEDYEREMFVNFVEFGILPF